jgi:uncharacterized protein YjbI with pentapeptide repeats
MQGQVQAVERLLQNGRTFSGKDLSGVALSGARLAGGDFTQAVMHFTAFDGADATAANFSKAGLRFADVSGADFSRATLSEVYAPFLSSKKKVRFVEARIEGANLFGAELAEADFTRADLRRTSFAFADLRGAIFDGADLRDTQFVGALLDGARFDGAIIANSDLLGASIVNVKFKAEQAAGACRAMLSLGREEKLDVWIRITEEFPSPRFESGYEHVRLVEQRYDVRGFADKSLNTCSEMDEEPSTYNAHYPHQMILMLRRDYLSNAGRRDVVQTRMAAFAIRLKALRAENTLTGPNTQISEWLRGMQRKSLDTTLDGSPYVTTDQILLLLLKHGVLSDEKLDWQSLAKARHVADTQLQKIAPKRLTENELSDFSRLCHDDCVEAIIEAQDVDRNHSTEV